MSRQFFALCFLAWTVCALGQSIVVGSKKFPESNILGEIARKVLTDGGYKVEHREDLGSTGIVWGALKQGDISLYPEYTGTITEEILKKSGLNRDQIEAALAPFGVTMGPDLGFNDSYGLVMRKSEADRLRITKISDLKAHPELRCGITHELLGRKDGWTPLLAAYGVSLPDTKAIDHSLGYAALASGQIDLKDCYTTDAQIQKFDLKVLDDDLHFFPLYEAVFLYRSDLPAGAVKALNSLAGTIREPMMIAMNAEAEKSKDYSEAASLHFKGRSGGIMLKKTDLVTKTLRLTGEHLELVGISLALAVLIGIPLGIWAAKGGLEGGTILGVAGVIQTIPSLALLALLVPIQGFGTTSKTAIVALFLYSLLPIIRNTAAGLQGIPIGLRESAEALGLSSGARLTKVYLPMAMPLILAGVKTSAVINVGTATIAALVGAEGLGQPIIQGLSLNDDSLILQGAIPAAALALLVQFGFDLLERAVVPRGLRL